MPDVAMNELSLGAGANDPAVASEPFMPAAEIAVLKAAFVNVSCFLEYGAGGSTRLAANLGVDYIYSVESDIAFAKLVEAQLMADNTGSKLHLNAVNIGRTRKWGAPIDCLNSREWPNYAIGIWDVIEKDARDPQLILIDGRFRVACFLASLLKAKLGTILLFDDYRARKHYHLVEKYLSYEEMVGRLAIFRVTSEIDCSSIAFDLARFCMDYR